MTDTISRTGKVFSSSSSSFRQSFTTRLLSSVVDFIGDFYIYDSEEYDVFHDKWRVFAKDFEKPNSELPEDTTQRRCFKRWLLDGKKTGAGAGIFIYDGEKFTK